MINKYLERLIEELGQDFMNKWSYAGGRIGRHKRYFDLFNKKKNLLEPEVKHKCACGHNIVENCYVYNKELNELEVVGNCCIKKFFNKSNRGRTCEECGSPHRNRKVNYCNKCRLKYCEGSNRGRTCEECGSPHRNRKVNYCNKCRLKYCEGCFKQKNNDYKYCYSCYEARQKSNN